MVFVKVYLRLNTPVNTVMSRVGLTATTRARTMAILLGRIHHLAAHMLSSIGEICIAIFAYDTPAYPI